MTETVADAVEKKEAGALTVMDQNKNHLTQQLPSHIPASNWYASAEAAVRKDRDLYKAANASPGSLMNALTHAARLGLVPGTEQFYLTWRRVKGQPEVLGMPGYQGEVELIYRAGAVSSVIVELVRENDTFTYVPGRDEKPLHEVDWFGDRGAVKGSYAYAIMRDGATSKVVVVGEERIKRAIDASPTANSSHSPWKTDYGAMVLKTAAHDLQKWVPTSAEYMREQLRAVQDVASEAQQNTVSAPAAPPAAAEPDVLDGEIVDQQPAEPEPEGRIEEHEPQDSAEPKSSEQQRKDITAAFTNLGVTDSKDRLDVLSTLVGRPATTTTDLTELEATQVLDMLTRCLESDDPVRALDAVVAAVGEEEPA